MAWAWWCTFKTRFGINNSLVVVTTPLYSKRKILKITVHGAHLSLLIWKPFIRKSALSKHNSLNLEGEVLQKYQSEFVFTPTCNVLLCTIYKYMMMMTINILIFYSIFLFSCYPFLPLTFPSNCYWCVYKKMIYYLAFFILYNKSQLLSSHISWASIFYLHFWDGR